jgi:hypothetical protein
MRLKVAFLATMKIIPRVAPRHLEYVSYGLFVHVEGEGTGRPAVTLKPL